MTLKKYMPNYYDGIREMNELLNIEDRLLLEYSTEFNKVKDNQFIMTSDLDGIKIYERILGITASPSETLGFRRSRALNRWVDIIPYTHNALYSKIAMLQGNYDFDIEYEFGAYRISIRTNLELSGQVDELDYALMEMVPANIEVISKNEIQMISNAQSPVVMGMTPTMIISASDSYQAALSTENDITYISSTMAQISEITI